MKIACLGKMCSGKTTLSNHLLEIEPRLQVFSFGKKVKEVAADLFDMDPLVKDRTLLTAIGHHMRIIDPDVWVNYVAKQSDGLDFCLIDDLRYQNEYDALANKGWIFIQLMIDDELQEKRIREVYPNNYQDHLNNRNHFSERNDFIIHDKTRHLCIYAGEDIDEIVRLAHEFIRS